MEEEESIYHHIKHVFGELPKNCNVLEEQIDVNLQLAYFDFSKKLKVDGETDESVVDDRKDLLFREDTPVDKKKEILVLLAGFDNVSFYRTIESYLENPDAELREWAILAKQESKMLLQSRLMDEEQVFISTGLGGKGLKLRYFLVLLSSGGGKLSERQMEIVKKEFEFILKHYDVEIEEIYADEMYVKASVIIPLQASIKDIFKSAINECNQFGNFLLDNFLITNVKKLDNAEIKEILDKSEKEE